MKRPSKAANAPRTGEDSLFASEDISNSHPLIDPNSLAEFTELLGAAQAEFWLREFREELCAEFALTAEAKLPQKNVRERVHHYCGRAGFIGFSALHAACVDYLERSAMPEVSATAYDQIRVQAERVCAEIDRRIAQQR
ncbi:MAG: hypothetical protein ACXIUW_11645 [Roseinatronobacter sp.]